MNGETKRHCTLTTLAGTPCRNPALSDLDVCGVHHASTARRLTQRRRARNGGEDTEPEGVSDEEMVWSITSPGESGALTVADLIRITRGDLDAEVCVSEGRLAIMLPHKINLS